MVFVKNKKFIFIPAIYVVSVFFLLLFIVFFYRIDRLLAQSDINSSDAIAIRVLPNPNHYSALRWYNDKKFNGSPQSLTVDGYEAVRDGRTVYVNVANVAGENLYTNIYLISYNQEAQNFTIDFFSNILAHWKFNTNLSGFGHCRKSGNVLCSSDLDCSLDDFCDSLKARVIRDTRRLADLAEIKILLDNYHNQGFYPKLTSGTYLPNKTLSAWPSWRDTLADDLGSVIPIDPVNILGPCQPESTYNKTTCWDENAKQFVNSDWPNLPRNSLVYTYYTNSNSPGSDSRLCANFESGLNIINDYKSSFCPEICLDFDNDGYGLYASTACTHPETDCNDTDPNAPNSAVPEAGNCNDGVDNDCDGLIDCSDSDCSTNPICTNIPEFCGDHACNNGETNAVCPDDCPLSCSPNGCNNDCPFGCTLYSQDPDCGTSGCCDDGTCNLLNESSLTCPADCTTECSDNDGDGYIAENIDHTTCGSVCGISHNQACIGNYDCNDNIATIFLGASEPCDGIDNNCDEDPDNGHTAETCSYVCMETATYNYNSSRSGNSRCCGNDTNEGNPFQTSERTPVDLCADGRDNDCDGDIDAADSDCSGICANTGENDWINAATPGDCNQCDFTGNQDVDPDEDWSAYPAWQDFCDNDCGVVSVRVPRVNFEFNAELTCNDNIDNDCDGQTDCTDSNCASASNCVSVCTNGSTRACGSDIGVCQSGLETCVSGSWSGNCIGEITSGVEICNGLDDDCDSQTDEGLSAPLNDTQYGVCAGSLKICSGASGWVNNYSTVLYNEYPVELSCDNRDNNCNNIVDDGLTRACYSGPAPTQGVGVCVGGNQTCATGVWGTCVGEIIPGAEICGNTADEDCDGSLDNSCGAGTCTFPFTFPCTFP